MKITIESTDKIVQLNGVPARIWEGRTEAGIPLHCYVARVAVAEGLPSADYVQFETELREHAKPSPEIQAIPLRLVI